jgi:predicted deacetylase
LADSFIVCVHDAWPAHARQIADIFEVLKPRVGRAVSVAVVPLPAGRPWAQFPADAASLVEQIHDRSDEILLHGLTHRRPASASPASWIIGGNDEFAALPRDQALRRLRQGAALLRDLFGVPVRGVLPPAWRAGTIPAALGDAGLRFIVGMASVRTASPISGGRGVRLATWSWDAGPVATPGAFLDAWGSVLSWCNRTAVPCVALHPADVTRRLLPRALRRIDHLIALGRRPTSFERLLDLAPPACSAP